MITSASRRRQNGEGVGTIGDRLKAEKTWVLPVLGIRIGIHNELNNSEAQKFSGL
ncbi:hypothetical protein D3C80_1991500 [compost metagenome]